MFSNFGISELKTWPSKIWNPLMRKNLVMNRHVLFYCAGAVLLLLLFPSCKTAVEPASGIIPQTLWYTSPAAEWNHALPVGNGRMGAMVFGGTSRERIQLNEDSLWPGGPDLGNSKGTPEDLKVLRELVLAGKVHDADREIVERFSRKWVLRSHQTMGDLYIDLPFSNVENYRRTLNLDSALVKVEYDADGAHITEQVFTSAPDNVMVIRLETTDEAGMDLNLSLDRPIDNGRETVEVSTVGDDQLVMKGEITQYNGSVDGEPRPMDYGVQFETIAQVRHEGGTIVAADTSLSVKGVKKLDIYLVSATSFYESDFAQKNQQSLTGLSGKTFDQLLQRHVTDFQSLYHRADLDLGGQELDSLATDVRLQRVKDGGEDPALIAKMFQYGRYLLISCSRPGANPANLQGLWNEHIEAPWNADYHVNINLQMNYWPAEVANLSECHEPLMAFIERLIERGRITAREQYGLNGAVIHHTTDLWAPAWMRAVQPYWGSWIHGGGWIVQHMWEHYQFTQDETFLRDHAYPALKAIAEFYVDWLEPHPETGAWISFPTTSPENSYIAADGKSAAVALGSAMDQQIISEVFDEVLAAAAVLGISDDFTREVNAKRGNMHPGLQIGPDGRLLEWDKFYEEPEKGHRHMSHLFALHPGNDITAEEAPEIFQAARKTLDFRLANGGAGTGWSRAWLINFSARLLDGNMAYEHIRLFLQKSTEINLFDMHPPFQIDGNFGLTAGIAEMLLQTQHGVIDLLPALPDAWPAGKVSGLKARGNFELDIAWSNGELSDVRITSVVGKPVQIKYGDKRIDLNLEPGESVQLSIADFR